MKYFFLSILLIGFLNCSSEIPENLLGNDIRLFKGNAWSLAKAVDKEDTLRIKKILKKGKIHVDIREPKFGQTLLIWAISQNRFNSARTLLSCGADPNLHDASDGLSAIIAAADKKETSEYLKLVLKYGGDPNNYVSDTVVAFCPTPLIAASRLRLESVKILLECGADVNFMSNNGLSALYASVISKRADVVYYLLTQCDVEFNKSLLTTIDGNELFITNLMRSWTFELNTEHYETKMKIVEFLIENGLDYWSTEIPARYYDLYPQEYLNNY